MSWTIAAHQPGCRPRRKFEDDTHKQAASWQHVPAAGTSEESNEALWQQQEGPELSPTLRPKKRLHRDSCTYSILDSQSDVQTGSRTDESSASHTSEPGSVCQVEEELGPTDLEPGASDYVQHETPVYHKNTRMPVDGWFQPCRYEDLVLLSPPKKHA